MAIPTLPKLPELPATFSLGATDTANTIAFSRDPDIRASLMLSFLGNEIGGDYYFEQTPELSDSMTELELQLEQQVEDQEAYIGEPRQPEQTVDELELGPRDLQRQNSDLRSNLSPVSLHEEFYSPRSTRTLDPFSAVTPLHSSSSFLRSNRGPYSLNELNELYKLTSRLGFKPEDYVHRPFDLPHTSRLRRSLYSPIKTENHHSDISGLGISYDLSAFNTINYSINGFEFKERSSKIIIGDLVFAQRDKMPHKVFSPHPVTIKSYVSAARIRSAFRTFKRASLTRVSHYNWIWLSKLLCTSNIAVVGKDRN